VSVTVSPPGADEAGALPEPPVFPYRPLPDDLARRVRRRAWRRRARHVVGSLVLAGAAVGTLWLVTPGRGGAGPPPPRPVDDPTPLWPAERQGPPPVRTDVGLGGSAWIGDSGPELGSAWCVGPARAAVQAPAVPDAASPDEPGPADVLASCRFLPSPGRMDAAAFDGGVFAPAGQRLVVAVLIGQSLPGPAVRAELTDAGGPQRMRLDRPPGLPGVAYLWAFTTGGPVSIAVYDGNADLITSCAACTETSR